MILSEKDESYKYSDNGNYIKAKRIIHSCKNQEQLAVCLAWVPRTCLNYSEQRNLMVEIQKKSTVKNWVEAVELGNFLVNIIDMMEREHEKKTFWKRRSKSQGRQTQTEAEKQFQMFKLQVTRKGKS